MANETRNKMNEKQLIEIKNRVIALTEAVAKEIKDAPFSVDEKEGVLNIVTSNDIKSQRMLVEGLSEILPEAGFFCEEEGLRDTESEYIWVIDPIDGTANYARGIGDSAISVALISGGEPLVGVVKNISREECFSAVKGLGAELNGRAIRVSKRSFDNGLLCTAMSLYKKEHAKVCSDIIFDAYLRCNDVRRFGSCAIELCYLAAGMCELYFEIRVFPWDFGAALLILREAGGVARGLQDSELSYTRPTVVIGANNEENYRILSDIVNSHLQNTPYED